jgi:hypothetical protein
MANVNTCPTCGQSTSLRPDLARQAVQCPNCGAAPPESAAPGPCPACDAERNVYEEDERPWDRPDGPGRLDAEPHRGKLIDNLGQVSMVCFPLAMCLGLFALSLGLGIAAWVMATRDLRKMRAGLMDRRGEGATRRGRYYGVVGACLNAAGLPTYFGVGMWLDYLSQ